MQVIIFVYENAMDTMNCIFCLKKGKEQWKWDKVNLQTSQRENCVMIFIKVLSVLWSFGIEDLKPYTTAVILIRSEGDMEDWWIERATPGQGVMGSISAPYWLGRCQYVTGWDRSHGLPALSLFGSL